MLVDTRLFRFQSSKVQKTQVHSSTKLTFSKKYSGYRKYHSILLFQHKCVSFYFLTKSNVFPGSGISNTSSDGGGGGGGSKDPGDGVVVITGPYVYFQCWSKATSSAQNPFTPKKDVWSKTLRCICVFFSFSLFHQPCFSQTKLPNNSALHEFKNKKLNSCMELPLQDSPRQTVKYATENTFHSVVIISNKLRNRKHVPCFSRGSRYKCYVLVD